jgi:hypothetical protein
MSAQSEAALLTEEQLREHNSLNRDRLIGGQSEALNGLVASVSPLPDTGTAAVASGTGVDSSAGGAQLIGGMVDLPNGLVSSISPGPSADGSASASGGGANGSTGGAQLIGGMVDLPGGLVASVTPTGADNQISANAVGAKNPHLGVQLIGGVVDLPGGLIASPAQDLPENLGHGIGSPQHFPTGVHAPGTAEGAGQLHQLVTAMAGFGGDQGSVITNLITQNEVESARTSLAASLHFTP